MDKKAIIGIVLAAVAVLLLVLTFVTPWYSISTQTSYQGEEMESSTDMHFDEFESNMGNGTDTQEYEDDSEIKSVMDLTMIFTIIAIIGSLVGLAGAVLVGLGKLGKKIGALLAVVGLIFALIAPLYMMVGLPTAFEEDGAFGGSEEGPHESFFGSYTQEAGGAETEMSWGPTLAWYFALIAGILNIGVIALVFKSSPAPDSTAGGKQYQQQPSQQDQRGETGLSQQQQPSQQQRGATEPSQQQQPSQQQRGETGPSQQQPSQQEQSPTPGATEEPEKTCSTCGDELRYIDEYDRWYCDNCQEYE